MSKALELADWILSDPWSGHTTYVREQLFRVTQELTRLAAVEAELKAIKEAEPDSEAEAEPAEPTGYLVEGENLGKVIAKVMYFTLDEAKSTASIFSQHYPTVHTKALYTLQGESK